MPNPVWTPPIMLPGMQPQGVPLYAPVQPSVNRQISDQSKGPITAGICGFEVTNGAVYGPQGGSSVLTALNSGANSFDAVTFRAPGLQSLLSTKTLTTDNAYMSIILPSTTPRHTFRGYFNMPQLPSTANGTILGGYNTNTAKVTLNVTTAGVMGVTLGSASQNVGVTVTPGRWYRVDISPNLSVNPQTVDIQITDETTNITTVMAQLTNAQAADTMDRWRLGCVDLVSSAWSINWDDVAYRADVTGYPIGAGYIVLASPTSVGVHKNPAAFIDHTAAALSSSDSTSFQEFDDPGTAVDTTTYVAQTGDLISSAEAITSYLEYLFAAPSHTGTGQAVGDVPRYVNAIVGTCGQSVSTNRAQQTWIVDGYDTYESIINRSTITGTGVTYNNIMLPFTPGGRLWTDAEITGLRFRYGAPSNVSNQQRLTFVGIEIEYIGAITDSGVSTMTLTNSADEAHSDSTGSTTTTTGGLSSSGTREALTADIVWLESYTFTEYAQVSQYQWQYKGTPAATEHWKLVVYEDNGSGAPGALYYVGAEQTIVVPGAPTQTATVSPSDLGLPPGTWWIGEHLKEANLAPTYQAHAGVTYDAPDTYSDGPNDPFTGGSSTDNLRDKLITYSTWTVVRIVKGSATAEVIAESNTSSLTVSQTGVEELTLIEAGTSTITLTQSASSEAIADSGTSTATLTETGTDVLTEPGSSDITLSQSASSEAIAEANASQIDVTQATEAEAIAESQTDSFTITGAGDEIIPDSGSSDITLSTGDIVEAIAEAATDSFALSQATESEAIAEASSDTFAITETGSEAIAESNTTDITLTQSGSEVVTGGDTIDSGTSDIDLSQTALEAIAESGTSTITVSQSRFREALSEPGSTLVTLTQSASEAMSDGGVDIAVASNAASEALAERNTSSLAVTQSRASEALAESNTSPLTLTQSFTFDVGEIGTTTITITSIGGEVITEAGTSSIAFLDAAREAIADNATSDITITQTAAESALSEGQTTVTFVDGAASESIAEDGTTILTISASGHGVKIVTSRGRILLSDSPTRKLTLTLTSDQSTLTDSEASHAGFSDTPRPRGGFTASRGGSKLEDS